MPAAMLESIPTVLSRRRPLDSGALALPIAVTEPLSLVVADERLRDLATINDLEWLEPNGLGGFAAGTVSGIATRRYHGLLIAATEPPVRRRLLVAKLAETVVVDGVRTELDANEFEDGTAHPRGFERLERFEQTLAPRTTFAGDGFRLRRTVVALHGRNATAVVYELAAAARPIVLELAPLLAGRDLHALTRTDGAPKWRAVDLGGGRVRFESLRGEPTVTIAAPGSGFETAPSDWYRFAHAEERRRGFDWLSDLHVPGRFHRVLEPGERLVVLVEAGEAAGDASALVEAELERRKRLIERSGFTSPFAARLVLAADAFLVRRGSGCSVLAGYPWFADWGRDAMIALPGLALATRRFDEAREVLRSFAHAVDRGMLPNRFPDSGEPPEYNTVDATLWLFVAAWRYLEATGDEAFVREELVPRLDEIVAWHGRGTRHGIRIDGDGLLLAGEPGVQLTWMDARVGERVVTPRHGKPVEVQALWINALRIMAELHRRFGRAARGEILERLADAARGRFEELFWNEEREALHDCIAADGTPDPTLRPNQLYALALPWPSLGPERARRVLATVERELLTPVGLRTLAPTDPAYRRRYEGGPEERDTAYHQGTVWPFLVGIYVCALVRYRAAEGRRAGRELVERFATELSRGALGTISEIHDAEPPHVPRGAFAQAWSVAELLRALRCLETECTECPG